MKNPFFLYRGSPVALILITMVIYTGCFTLRTASRSDLTVTEKTIFVIHSAKQVFRLNTAIISDGTISGLIDPSAPVTKGPNTVQLFIAPDSAIKRTGLMVEIPVVNVAKVEIPKFDLAKTAVKTVLVTGAAAVVYVTILFIFKGVSCPFIYENTGSGYEFSGEIYSGATAIPLEREDYLKLEKLKPVDGKFTIRISNEVNEVQNTNLAELIVIDHNNENTIKFDRDGVPFATSHSILPASATNIYGQSVMAELLSGDSSRYISPVKNDEVLFDTVFLKFSIPDNVRNAALVIKARNTMWLDYAFGEFSDLFGNRYEKWKEQRNSKSYSELTRNSLDQGVPLKVFTDYSGGEEYIGFFHLPGPMADREQAILIDPRFIQNGVLTLKLTSGVLFWDIDQVYLSVIDKTQFSVEKISASTAIDEKGNDVREMLKGIDSSYLVQPEPGNITELSFPAPPQQEGKRRSLFLHSSGHYEVLRNPGGKPDIAYLKTFNKPGVFTKYSKEKYLNLRLTVSN